MNEKHSHVLIFSSIVNQKYRKVCQMVNMNLKRQMGNYPILSKLYIGLKYNTNQKQTLVLRKQSNLLIY